MSTFLKDRIPITCSMLGGLLMLLVIVWRINPIEGSVMPSFLQQNVLGQAIILFLLIACIPTWIAMVPVGWLFSNAGGDIASVLLSGCMILMQMVIYFTTAKLILLLKRRLSNTNKSSSGQTVG